MANKEKMTQHERFVLCGLDLDSPCGQHESDLEVSEETLNALAEDIMLWEMVVQDDIRFGNTSHLSSDRRSLLEAKIAYRDVKNKLYKELVTY